jgi:hypothetical protein
MAGSISEFKSSFSKDFSTRREHEAQVIPPTLSSTLLADISWERARIRLHQLR